jgi:outer membrane lipoprotein-sorting protein
LGNISIKKELTTYKDKKFAFSTAKNDKFACRLPIRKGMIEIDFFTFEEEIMRKTFKLIAIFAISLSLLSACSDTSFKDESEGTIKAVKASFNSDKASKSNKKNGQILFYLPMGFQVKNSNPNNIILKNGSRTYILFINPRETSSSKVVYKSSVAKYKKMEVNESFTHKNKFGYLLIHRSKDDRNELTVGVGGNKITTETETSHMQDEAKIMMNIVNSVKMTR